MLTSCSADILRIARTVSHGIAASAESRDAVRAGVDAAWPVSDEKIALEYKLKRMLAGSLMSAERGHVYWNGTFSDSEKTAQLVAGSCPVALDNMLAELRGRTLAAMATT